MLFRLDTTQLPQTTLQSNEGPSKASQPISLSSSALVPRLPYRHTATLVPKSRAASTG